MEQYEFSGKAKKWIFIAVGLGVLLMLVGAVMGMMDGSEAAELAGGDHGGHGGEHGHGDDHGGGHGAGWGQRIWSNLLINGLFFFGIGLAGTFFLAVNYAAHAGWSVVLKRVFEAVSAYMPIGALILVIIFAAGTFHLHHLYHWMDASLYTPYMIELEGGGVEYVETAVAGAVQNPHYDEIIAGKQPYLSQWFWWLRAIVFLGVYIFFANRFRKRSLEEDITGGVSLFKRNVVDAAVFLVFFGFTSMAASWDWIMSIDTHWFSTIFGWYIFSGWWIGALTVMTIMVLHLKRIGLLKVVNDSHIHDLGKWMFAISFLWSYLFFCQFMLIWYSNIPEEVTYYQARIQDYQGLFWTMFFLNFAFPMLMLMSRDAKRNTWFLTFVGAIIFVGHWLDTFMLITPGTMKTEWHLGFFEAGLALVFLGFFSFIVLRALSKAPVVVKNHPYLAESTTHHI